MGTWLWLLFDISLRVKTIPRAVVGFLGALACAPAPTRVDVRDAPEFGLVVITSQDGARLASGVFQRDQAPDVFVNDDDRAVLFLFSAEDLKALYPYADPRPDVIKVELARETCEDGRVLNGEVALPVPRTAVDLASMKTLPPEDLPAVTLRMPINAASCSDLDARPLEPFSPSARAIPSPASVGGVLRSVEDSNASKYAIEDVVPLRSGKVIGRVLDALFVFDPHAEYRDEPSSVLPVSRTSSASRSIMTHVTVDPSDERIFILVEEYSAPPDTHRARSRVFELDPQLRPTEIFQTTAQVEGLFFDVRNDLLIVSEEEVGVLRAGARSVELRPSPFRENVAGAWSTFSQEDPHAAITHSIDGTLSRVLFGDFTTGEVREAPTPFQTVGYARATTKGRGGVPVTVLVDNAGMVQVEWDLTGRPLHPVAPPGKGGRCAGRTDACGRTVLAIVSEEGVASDPEAGVLYIGQDDTEGSNCPEVLAYRPADRCAIALPLPDLPGLSFEIESVGVRYGHLVVGAQQGFLFHRFDRSEG
ncbi:MAG: hypothetical protein HYV07_14145 [Deltaproteobacteria bacterium]|nr:hypothetical protein [Deltaproteobacteria bacterium]